MRTPRQRIRDFACYYHLYNRATGMRDSQPFGPGERDLAYTLLRDLQQYFSLELIAATIMPNHYHIVLYAPVEPPDTETAVRRHNTFYDKSPTLQIDLAIAPAKAKLIAHRMVDVGAFVSNFQQRFSTTINARQQRHGSLWASRYKSTILEGTRPLWLCVQYNELNPVRSGLCADPAAYPHSSWGQYQATGQHPFARAFVKHLRASLGERARQWSANEVYAEFRDDLARALAGSGAPPPVVPAADAPKDKRPPLALKPLERTRFYTDGLAIGSEAFVREIATRLAVPFPTNPRLHFTGSNGRDTFHRLRRLNRQPGDPQPPADA